VRQNEFIDVFIYNGTSDWKPSYPGSYDQS